MIWSCKETSMGMCGYRVVTLGVILVLIFTVNIHEVGASVAKTQLENTGIYMAIVTDFLKSILYDFCE